MTIEVNTLSQACFINPDGEQVCTSQPEEPPVETPLKKNKLKKKRQRLIKGSVSEVRGLLASSPLKNVKSAEELQRTLNKSGYNLAEDGYVGNKTKAALNSYLSNLKKPSTTEVAPAKTTPVQNSVDEVYSYPFLNNRDLDKAKYDDWHAWDGIAKRWRDTHKGQRFSEAMKQAGYTYDYRLGRYVNKSNLGYVPSKKNPGEFVIVQANDNSYLNNTTADEIIENIEGELKFNRKRAQYLKSKQAEEQGMQRWNIFINNNAYKGTYAKTGAKLIKKHSGGGWIGDKSKGVWDYSDSTDKDIQKKIARYYVDMDQDDTEQQQALNYLNQHTDLADYLDTIYKKGINWDGQKALGNIPNQPWQTIKNSKGEVQYTDKLSQKARSHYAKAMGYDNLEDFNKTLRDAGYKTYKGFVEKDGNQYFLTPEVLKNNRGFFGPKGRILTVNVRDLKPIATQHQKYLAQQAKKVALQSAQSEAWGQVGQHLGLQGTFYDRMLKYGYHYVPDKGYYMNNDGTKIFLKRGQVRSKQGASEKALTWGDLKSMLKINK